MTANADVDDFELIRSTSQLADPPPLRKEPVTLSEWKTKSGKAARFLAWELTAADHAEFIESGRVYNAGVFQRYDSKEEDVRFLAHTLRDQHGNRLWNKVEDAKAQLGHLGRGDIQLLIGASNRVNSPREAAKEGNSEGTKSDS